MNPLEKFKSERVKDLLIDFFEQNFVKAGVEKNLGKSLVEEVWKSRGLPEKDIKLFTTKKFNRAAKQANSGISEVFVWELFDLSKVKTFVDVGANKLRRINELAGIYRSIDLFIGVDVVPQANKFNFPERCEYIQIRKGSGLDRKSKFKNQNLNGSILEIESGSVDLVNIQYVLHHFGSDGEIVEMIEEVYRILKPGGRLLLWEESYIRDIEVRELVLSNNQLGIETDFELTKRFYQLNDEEKFEFILINDWIVNVNNPHMQWTLLYKPWTDWEVLLNSSGFGLLSVHDLGLRKNAMIKQGVHVVGEFIKPISN